MMQPEDTSSTFWKPILRSVLQGALAGLILGGVFLGGFFYRGFRDGSAAHETISQGLLDEVTRLLATHYLYDIPDEKFRLYGAAAGLVSAYGDPYTRFVEPVSAEIDEDSLAGRFGGIGAELSRDEQGRFVISRVYEGNPAFTAGIKEGDIIVAVDGNLVDEAAPDMNDVLAAIRGEIGTQLTLTVERNGETIEYEITRAEVLIPSVYWTIVEDHPAIGYVQLTRFTDRAPEEIREAINSLTDQGAESLIFDLRGNGGGLVDSATGVASEFLDAGVILYEQRQDRSEEVFNATRGGSAVDMTMVVLVDGGSASASEIVAGALQDRGRAILIGQKTFGKGSVQLIFQLSDSSSLHITNAEWFTPNHHRIQDTGLNPDIVVEPMEGRDAQLQRAIEYLEE